MMWLISFTIAIIIDLLVKRFLSPNALTVYMKLVNNSYLNIFIAVFVLFYLIMTVLIYLDLFHIHIYSEVNFNFDSGVVFIEPANDSISVTNSTGLDVKDVTSAANNTINVGQGGSVTVNNPKTTITVPVDPLYAATQTFAATGGVAAGVKLAQMIGGTPVQKLGLTLGTAAFVQASSIVGSKILQSKTPDSNDNKNNFIQYFINNLDNQPITSHTLVDYSQFPLNLIPELDILSSLSIFFFFFILNIYTVRLIITIDFSKYMPNNSLGRLILKMINKYISMWSRLSNFFLILGWCLLLGSILMVKLCVYFIANA